MLVHVHQAIHRKAQRQLGAFAAVPADQRAASRIEHLDRALHHLTQGGFHLPVHAGRHGGNGSGSVGLGAHGKQVAQRMVGGNAPEHIGVVQKRAEEVHAVHQRFAGRHAHHGSVVRAVQA